MSRPYNRYSLIFWLAAWVMALTLSACGGGGGAGDNATAEKKMVATTAPAAIDRTLRVSLCFFLDIFICDSSQQRVSA